MTIIAWKPIYETGIVVLDKEHQVLIEQINTLFEAVRDKRGAEVLDEILATLQNYTENHFRHEEKLLADYNFPGLAEHRQIHDNLRRSVQDLKAKSGLSSRQELARELLAFLRNWLLEHIVEVDKKYGPFLESRGGRFIS